MSTFILNKNFFDNEMFEIIKVDSPLIACIWNKKKEHFWKNVIYENKKMYRYNTFCIVINHVVLKIIYFFQDILLTKMNSIHRVNV